MFTQNEGVNMRSFLGLTKKVDLEELTKRESGSKDTLEKRRLMAIRLRFEGYTPPQVCAILRVHPSSLRNWVNSFNKHGLPGLRPQEKRLGRNRKLTNDQINEVCKWLDEGPSEKHGCCFWTGKKLMQAIEKEFGVKYSLDGVYWLLRNLGYRRLVAKTHHYKSDPKAAEEFKKNSRIWSRR